MPKIIDNYEIGRTLGKGMSAKVKLGKDRDSGTLVALKIINKANQTSRQIELLNREILALKSLSHPNILSLLHQDMDAAYPQKCGFKKSCVLLVLEFAQNGELFNFLFYTGAFSELIARTYFSQLISALEVCHAHGIYHRDIKPENLLLDNDFQLKVADFGLAAVIETETETENDESRTGLLTTECGTRSYMPPEMLMQWPYDGSKADIWSSIVVLFIMLSGVPPFQFASTQDWWFKQLITNRRDRFWRAHLKNTPLFPVEARGFIDRVLIPRPENRPTIEQIKEDAWMSGNSLLPIQLKFAMLEKRDMMNQKKEQERKKEMEKMKLKQTFTGAFNPFTSIMRSVEPSELPDDIELIPDNMFYSSEPVVELYQSLVERCQASNWEYTEKPEQYKLKIISITSMGKIEWNVRIYSIPSCEGLNAIYVTKCSGDSVQFFKLVKEIIGEEQSSDLGLRISKAEISPSSPELNEEEKENTISQSNATIENGHTQPEDLFDEMGPI